MVTIEANLTADAIVSREKFRDSFTRTVGGTNPAATTDWGPDWVVTYVPYDGLTWVDGSMLRASAWKSAEGELSNPSAGRIGQGFVQFDFWVPANTSDSRLSYWLSQGSEFPVGFEVYQNSGSTWQAGVYYYYTGIDAYVDFVPDASTWYRFKGVFIGEHGGLLGVKVWKASDPEPSSFQDVGEIGFNYNERVTNPAYWINPTVYFSSAVAEEGRFDNLVYGDYGPLSPPSVYATRTASAILKKTMPQSFTTDAVIAPMRFTAGAWIAGNRLGHSRLLDHYGTQPDTVVVLDGAIEKYVSGTDLHVVLEDLIARVTALEDGVHVVLSFGMGAFIQPYFTAGAVIFRTVTYDPYWLDLDLKMDAVIVGGKTEQPITADALIIKSPVLTFGASAYLIDLVC